MSYSHLKLEEREKLYALREKGKSFHEIGKLLNRNHTTLSREYRRNAKYGRAYLPCRAQSQSERRASKQRYQAPLKNPKVFLYVRRKLRMNWAPEQIAGRLSIDYPGESIHHETIYRYIYNNKKTRGMKLWKHLTLHRRRRMRKYGRKVKREKIVNAIKINERPSIVETRKQAGHWETDNMGGKSKDRKGFSVTVERKTLFSNLSLTKNRRASSKTDVVVKDLRRLPKKLRQTLTADNGSENADHERLSSKLNLNVFFCNAYHSWEKGTVENTIGRIRRLVPKGTSIDTLSQNQAKAIEYWLNHTPRKRLKYLTPCEKMQQELRRLQT